MLATSIESLSIATPSTRRRSMSANASSSSPDECTGTSTSSRLRRVPVRFTRPRSTPYPGQFRAHRHHVAGGRHDDGHRGRRLLEHGDAGPARDNDVRLEPYELGGERGQAFVVTVRPPALDGDVASLDVPEVTEPLPHGLDLARVAGQ